MTEGLMLVAAGLVVLVAGGELLVQGASQLAAIVGVSPLVIGLTVVAFGTSAPELAVSMKACLGGQTDIAVGNVVGSNIFNTFFILGVSALIAPLIVSSRLIRLDVPLMIAVCAAVLAFGLDGTMSRFDGGCLFAGLLCYTTWSVFQSRQESLAVQKEFEQEFAVIMDGSRRRIVLQILLITGGLALLVFGARWLVDGSVTIARLLGMSELLIGLTIVAAGTSLPEVAASVLASIRGERDIAVGNVVGSNIFNVMCVLGLSAAISPRGIEVSEAALRLDIPVMIAAALLCLPIFFTDHRIARWEGGLFLAYYCAYMAYLILSATYPAVSRSYGFIIVTFVVPLTAVPILVSVLGSMRRSSEGR